VRPVSLNRRGDGNEEETAETIAGDEAARYQVFVRHATTDKWIARMICEKIEGAGATTFRDDRDIESGDDIPGEIRKQLIGLNELAIPMTPGSVRRAWVLLEAGAFWRRKKKARIVAVLCHAEIISITGGSYRLRNKSVQENAAG